MVLIRELISRLNAASVEYVIIGGVAARLHGSPMVTEDLDICCAMTEQNMTRLLDAIGPLNPVWFDPRRIPLPRNPSHLAKFRTMLLLTTAGRFDVLREVEPLGEFPAVVAESELYDLDGMPVRVLSIDALIRAKSVAGRQKDTEGIMHLEAVKKRKLSQPPPPPPPP
jgi:hypothetical protein